MFSHSKTPPQSSRIPRAVTSQNTTPKVKLGGSKDVSQLRKGFEEDKENEESYQQDENKFALEQQLAAARAESIRSRQQVKILTAELAQERAALEQLRADKSKQAELYTEVHAKDLIRIQQLQSKLEDKVDINKLKDELRDEMRSEIETLKSELACRNSDLAQAAAERKTLLERLESLRGKTKIQQSAQSYEYSRMQRELEGVRQELENERQISNSLRSHLEMVLATESEMEKEREATRQALQKALQILKEDQSKDELIAKLQSGDPSETLKAKAKCRYLEGSIEVLHQKIKSLTTENQQLRMALGMTPPTEF